MNWEILAGDSAKYFVFPLKFPDLLFQQVPCGYPVFLHLVHWVDHSYALLPGIQYFIWEAAEGLCNLWMLHDGEKLELDEWIKWRKSCGKK
jgi:hypothetical protein